ncbi:flagellar hook-length control protein FliK [Bradyrhizobium diazoefficiens]|nr:flagellar hook-length control protein FliK [Bradyrhizobium diazoefficiens]
MVSRTSDVAASVQVPGAQQKPARSQGTKDNSTNDSFGALVDSNTQAISNAQPQDTAPRKTDNAAPPAPSKGSRDNSATDQPAQAKASDGTDNSAPDSDMTADAAMTPDKPAKDKAEPETSDAKPADKSDETKVDGTGATDGLAAAIDAAAAAQTDAPQAPDPNAIVIAAPVVPTDATTPASQPTPASPLTIAAAGLAASASTAAQIAGTTTDTATPGDKTAKTAGAKVDADTTATLGNAATGAPETTDTASNGVVIAAVEQGTPKTSFKAAVTAQAQTEISNIGQEADKTTAAPTLAPAAATPASAPHPQAAKPETEAGATEPKATVSERGTDAAPAASVTHAHTTTQTVAAPADTGAQAASAVQAPVTTTTSAATASTATLTATVATPTTVPVSGIPVEIVAALHAGKTRFDIRLDPAELGRIDVRINVDRNGQVTSHLTVEKPETLSMLRQDAPQLQRALDDAGLKTGSNGLSFSLRDQNASGQNAGQNNDNGGNARRLIISEEDASPAAPVGRGYGRMLGSSSGIDIRV